jgi:hypothetical protein
MLAGRSGSNGLNDGQSLTVFPESQVLTHTPDAGKRTLCLSVPETMLQWCDLHFCFSPDFHAIFIDHFYVKIPFFSPPPFLPDFFPTRGSPEGVAMTWMATGAVENAPCAASCWAGGRVPPPQLRRSRTPWPWGGPRNGDGVVGWIRVGLVGSWTYPGKYMHVLFIIYIYGYGSIPIHTIFRGMNIHLPAILMFTRGTRFWHTAIYIYISRIVEVC